MNKARQKAKHEFMNAWIKANRDIYAPKMAKSLARKAWDRRKK
jgi:hypothetical protein